jgi:ferritin
MKILLLSCCISVAAAFCSLHQASPTKLLSPKKSTSLLPLSSTPFSIGGPSKELLELFNNQVTNEMAASQLYLSASIWFDQRDWEGFASYMLNESAEERGHALEFVDFAKKRNIALKLSSIPAPNSVWKSPEDVWVDILKHEQTNTVNLLHVAEAAQECQDYAVLAFLNPFHTEQVESESNISSIIAKVTDENETPGLLRQLDHELGVKSTSV